MNEKVDLVLICNGFLNWSCSCRNGFAGGQGVGVERIMGLKPRELREEDLNMNLRVVMRIEVHLELLRDEL